MFSYPVVDRDVGCIGVGLALALLPPVVLSSYTRQLWEVPVLVF